MARSIKRKILLPYSGLVLIVTILVGVVSHRMLVTAVVEQQGAMLSVVARAVSAEISHLVNDRRDRIRRLAHSDAAERYARDYAFYSLSRLFAENAEQFPLLTFVDESGREAERVEQGRPTDQYQDISDSSLFEQSTGRVNEVVMSQVEHGVWREPSISFIYTHLDFFDQFGGIIRGAAPLADLVRPARDERVGDLGFAMVVDAQGRLLSYPDQTRLFSRIRGDDESSQALVEAVLAAGSGFGRANLLGLDGFVAYAPIPTTPWAVMVTLPFEEFVEVPNELRNTIAVMALSTVGLLMAIGWFVSRLVTTPLSTLLSATEAVAGGEVERRAEVDSGDEFQDLADAFNRMVDERKRVEDSIRQARDEAQVAAKSKSEFLARMSHEIRTPMNGIMGMTDYLLYSELPAKQLECAQMIKSSSDQLLRVVNEILDYSRLESGKIELDIVEFDLRDLLERTVTLFADEASRQGLEIISGVPVRGPYRVRADMGRLQQILVNLLNNAIKFTFQGEIAVKGRIDERRDGVRLTCEVADTGIGVAEADRERIFDSFSQADSSTTREFGGTGLGLAICRQLVELMGGEIGVRGELERGSRFSFSVPVERGEDEEAEPVSERLRQAHALLVEDNPTCQRVVRQQLEAWGMSVTVAASGRRALELVRRDAYLAGDLDVALVDRTLPGVDGGTLARGLREARDRARLPMILLEVDVGSTFVDAAGRADFDATVRKPIHQRALRRALEQVMGAAGSDANAPASARASAAGPSAPYRARILVAEDNPMSQRVARRILEFLGVDVDIAVDGSQAVEMVAHRRYDLVFMDCNMPELDGYEATRRIRAREAQADSSERRLPIIALTASVLQEGRSSCFECGMDDFLAKPYEISDVHDMLEKWLHTDRGYPTAA